MSPRQPNTAGALRGALLADRYRAVRETTVGLAGLLAVEDQVVQPCEEASPTKWHLGHTAWFFERFVLGTWLRGYEAVDVVTSGSSTRTTTRRPHASARRPRKC